jgi:ankyrin repeat protein
MTKTLKTFDISEYLFKHKNKHYFKTKENDVACCDEETYKKYKKKDLTFLLIDAVVMQDIKEIKALINAGANINRTDEWGRTALHFASGNGYIEAIKILIEAKVDINKGDDWGHTALYYAILNNQIEAIKLLKEAGAK